MNVPLAIFLQVLVALAVVYGVHLMSLYLVMSKDIAAQEAEVRGDRQVTVVAGIAEAGTLANVAFDTVNVRARNFVALPRPSTSTSCDSGAAFTISFWMQMQSPPLNSEESVIFIKGDNRKYAYGNRHDYLIKCPLMRLSRSSEAGFTLAVEFNTLRQTDNVLRMASTEEVQKGRSLSHILGQWVMWTLVFSHLRRYDGVPNGVLLRVYLNDILYRVMGQPNDAVRTNNGDLTFFPQPPANAAAANMRIADFRYDNTALDSAEVKALFRRRFSTRPWVPPTPPGAAPLNNVLDMGPFNASGIHNTLA
jgi:hypothetical protein